MIKKMCIGLYVMYLSFLSYFNETLVFSTDFRIYSNIDFHENPSYVNQIVPLGHTDGQTDMQTLRGY